MPDEYIEINWEAEDGYVGGLRPQRFWVRASDFEYCESEADVQQMLEEMIDEDLKLKISWSCRYFDEYVSKIFQKAQALRAEE